MWASLKAARNADPRWPDVPNATRWAGIGRVRADLVVRAQERGHVHELGREGGLAGARVLAHRRVGSSWQRDRAGVTGHSTAPVRASPSRVPGREGAPPRACDTHFRALDAVGMRGKHAHSRLCTPAGVSPALEVLRTHVVDTATSNACVRRRLGEENRRRPGRRIHDPGGRRRRWCRPMDPARGPCRGVPRFRMSTNPASSRMTAGRGRRVRGQEGFLSFSSSMLGGCCAQNRVDLERLAAQVRVGVVARERGPSSLSVRQGGAGTVAGEADGYVGAGSSPCGRWPASEMTS